MKSDHIAILMATYNGEKYLREQIDSLLSQSFEAWHLYIHDDGSTDTTISLLNEYSERWPEKISILNYPSYGSACKNFLSLVDRVDAEYYMFCDQDDIWLKDKIKIELNKIKEIESEFPDKPVIINTDLTVTDASLNVIHPSFWRYANIKHTFVKSFKDFAAINVATGCTMLFNKSAKLCIHKPYDKAIMHDAWLTLSVVACGGVFFSIDKPTILYRQHGENTLGARDAKKLTLCFRLKTFHQIIKNNIAHYQQMNAIGSISIAEYLYAKFRHVFFKEK